jgi:hypothetical protein
MNGAGWEPPVSPLHARVADAIGDLASLRSTDPAARAAMQAVTLTRYTLEDFWLPATATSPAAQCG